MLDWVLPAGYAGNPAWYMFIAFVALAMTGVSKGGFGGIGTLSVPLMMLVVPDGKYVLGMWLPILVFCDIFTIPHYPKEFKPRPFLMIAPWTTLGIVVGWFLLGHIEATTTKLLVGITSLGFVGLDVVRARLKQRIAHSQGGPQPFRPSLISAAPFGLAAGVTTMIAHAAGAVTTIYFLPQRLSPRDFAGTQARYYFIFNTAKIPFFIKLGLINGETLTKILWMLPLAPLTVWLGAVLNNRMSPAVFHRVIYILLAVSGASLLYSNLGK